MWNVGFRKWPEEQPRPPWALSCRRSASINVCFQDHPKLELMADLGRYRKFNPKHHRTFIMHDVRRILFDQTPGTDNQKPWTRTCSSTPERSSRRSSSTPLGVSANRLATTLGIPTNRITAIIHGTRRITGETAILLGHAFDSSPEFWLKLQLRHDLDRATITVSPEAIRKAEKFAQGIAA